MKWFTRSNITSWSLAFVIAWFGLHEILQPAEWVVFAPSFIANSSLATMMVVAHGIVLTACAVLLITNYYRRLASGIVALMLAEIIISLISDSGLSDIAVRDIGLLGLALSNSVKSDS